MAIVVVTATVSGHLNKVYEAMGHGALDAVDTAPFAHIVGIGLALFEQRLLETMERLLLVRILLPVAVARGVGQMQTVLFENLLLDAHQYRQVKNRRIRRNADIEGCLGCHRLSP